MTTRTAAAAAAADAEAYGQQQQQPGVVVKHGYAVDIRIFLASITIAMALAFVAGVGLGGPVGELIPEMMMAATHHGGGPTNGGGGGASNLAALPASEEGGAGGGEPVVPVRDSYPTPNTIDWTSAQTRAKLMTAAGEGGADLHLPAGQHLLVDIEGVDGDFLNSEDRLSKAMVDTVNEAKLTLLSYHCHSLLPAGVSCVGVLLESHISFHTWPEDGVITLDLFTCGSNPLLPVVKTIERLFGIPAPGRPDGKVNTKWSHELRGFRPDDVKKKNYLDGSSDLSLWVLSPLEMYSKEQIYSDVTQYQRVDIWDVREVTDTPSYDDVKKWNMTPGDPRLLTPEFVTPDRLLFLDGILQSIQSSEGIYHEAMVHPAMFAHPNPERVVVVGGGEGATVREVLKHKTVRSVDMIELDRELVAIAREHLAPMSDCSNLVGRADHCLDDELVDIHYEDARKWFVDGYGAVGVDVEDKQKEKVDVILMDVLDPEEESSPNAEQLYTDTEFLSALLRSLSDDGVLAIQVGTASTIDDPREDVGIYKNREKLLRFLEANEDVEAMLVYEEPHCGFLEPHSFLIVCKSVECRGRWYARSDLVDYRIYDRIVRTKNKGRALTYYDGTTQHSYQWPKKGWETVYCRREPMPFECAYRTMDLKAEIHEYVIEDEAKGSFRSEAIAGEDGKDETRLYASKNIPKGSFVMPTHLASSLEVTDRNLEGLHKNVELGGGSGRVAVIEDLLEFFDDYAHQSASEGSLLNYVEVGGTCLIRRIRADGSEEGQANVKPWLPPHPAGRRPKYSPVYERHRVSFDVFIVASRDIKEGEEILMDEKMWKKMKN